MRKLTVKRRKSIAGCAGKVKIYIEDVNGDVYINGTKCRLLGKLKNNESAIYEIGYESLKLFAIYDKMSQDFCNDYYIIPDGENDIVVTGKAHLNPLGGNPFLFDRVTDKVVLANREKNRKKSMLILLDILVGIVIATILGIVIYNVFN